MLTIIDYGAGNIRSVANIIEHLGFTFQITNKKADIENAEKLIFPGQGAADSSMANLKDLDLIETIQNTKTPFLGICLGMQLLFDFSEEGDTKCLSIIPGKIKKFPNKEGFKIPQIGWNTVEIKKESALLKDIKDNSYVYFAHSYYCEPKEAAYTLGETDYIFPFTSAIQKDNFYGAQFHPEKSGDAGMQILKNFITEC